jgi:hypothetical protein
VARSVFGEICLFGLAIWAVIAIVIAVWMELHR